MKVPETARRAAAILEEAGIPALIAGGLAVQVHGYPRVTVDADLIVPDIIVAHQTLVAHGYRPSLKVPTGVIDPESDVRVDLLPGGKALTPLCPVNFPMPTGSGESYLTLPDLISVKLGSFIANPLRRARDKSDVIELIMRNTLPQDLNGIHPAVNDLYHEIWTGIQAEPEGPRA